MKRFSVLGVFVVAMFIAASVVFAACGPDCQKACCVESKSPATGIEIDKLPFYSEADRFGRGFLNAVFGWTVIFIPAGGAIHDKTEFGQGCDDIAWGGLDAFTRTMAGITDVFTFWVPQIPKDKMYKDTPFDLLARAFEGKKCPSICKQDSLSCETRCGTTCVQKCSEGK
ncbi:MAG: hypothetical protein P9M13_03710 [Candidatus Ancaeobacter aquaticus]|nr:hypothetical protein [Candidatus Ancaeobacter aquaticus]